MTSRREFLSASAAAAAWPGFTADPPCTIPDQKKPMFALRAVSACPVRMEAIEGRTEV